jgi:tRNA nucleotidyltransferase (CCA-adding enzyme)
MLNYPEKVIKIAEIMRKYGFRAYAVGGCVRDSIMGRNPSDWDMTTDASPEKMMEIFDSEGIRTIPTGLKHGTVTVLLDGETFELTTFRIDGGYTDSRHPDAVTFTRNLSDDLCRRDFTVNAMAADPLAVGDEGEITDLYGGYEDIKNRVIRAVGEPERRFNEDALRILRAVRFAAVLGFEIDDETKRAAKTCRDGLSRVSVERKKVEIEKMLISSGADRGIALLFELGLEGYVHSDISMPERSLSELPARFEVRMAALFDGVGCPDLSGLKLSRVESTGIKALCDKSAFCGELSEKNARRLLAKYGDLCEDAVILHGSRELLELVKEQRSKNPCLRIADLAISGGELKELGFEPRRIGEIMGYLLDLVIDEPRLNDKNTLVSIASDKAAE